MSTITKKQGSDREILHKEVGFPMARRKNLTTGDFDRFSVLIPEDLKNQLDKYLELNPDTDRNKTIRQSLRAFLASQLPSEPRRNIA
ncbi:hypothetical protein P3G55_16630 [Leptospira sp. 96542]|nr:hypothetical protein [Leptospira sp. 96542]